MTTPTYEELLKEMVQYARSTIVGLSCHPGSVAHSLMVACARIAVAMHEQAAIAAGVAFGASMAVAQTTMITPPGALPAVGDRVKRVYRQCVIYGIAEAIHSASGEITIRIDNIDGVSSALIGETRITLLEHWYADPVVFDKYGRCGLFPADFDSTAGTSTPPEPAKPEEPPPSCTNCATCKEPFPYGPMPADRPDGLRDCGRCKMMNGVFK